MATIATLSPHVRSGKLRMLGVSGKTRSAVLPEAPTFDEQGMTGYEAGNWIGIAAPAGTPPAVIARLNKEISAIQDSADFKSKLDADGAVVVKFTPAEFNAFMASELEKWGRVVKEANIKAESERMSRKGAPVFRKGDMRRQESGTHPGSLEPGCVPGRAHHRPCRPRAACCSLNCGLGAPKLPACIWEGTMGIRTFSWLSAAIGALVALAAPAAADDYPSRSVRIIIPYAPGGINDVAARALATHLTNRLGKQFIADNRTGAGGIVGFETAANAPPDGYTLAVISISNAVQPWLYKLPFDPHKAWEPIAMFVTSPNMLAVHPDVPAKSVKEFIALAKSKPGDIQYASGGTGGSLHTGMESVQDARRVDLLHVPFRGAGPARST